jgi:hypothetical protein
MKTVTIIAIVGVLAIAAASVGVLSLQGQSASLSTTTTTTGASLQTIPTPVGFLGAEFVSDGTAFPVSPETPSSAGTSNPDIPQSAASGFFSFLFSSPKYSESDLSLYVQSCNASQVTTSQSTAAPGNPITPGNGVGLGGGQNCSSRTILNFSYAQDSQGDYAVNSPPLTLPCGDLQMDNGIATASSYLQVSFGVNTIGQPGAAPYYYIYAAYLDC